ncbi:DUF58 domain-containing protein [Anaerolineales bacterium HSG6]|nr:DUF58 domain-containing protein [Anaerolineales bacterium HSG6]
MKLFDPTFMRRLEQLSLVIRRARVAHGQGEHRSRRRGSSVEFADYRDYTPGDDLRHLDWHIYARLERPFIKLFEAEEDLTVHLVLDSSGSMNWPPNDNQHNKWNVARRLVAALGYIALISGDRLTVSYLHGNEAHRWRSRRGRAHVHALLKYLEPLKADGPTELNEALYRLTIGSSGNRAGLLFLISDFFTTDGYERGLAALQSVGHEVNLLHLLSPDEIDPALVGDLRLHDVETNLSREVSVTGDLRQLYRQKFQHWRDNIEKYCFARDMNYITLSTEQSFETIILGHMRQRGFVR